VYIVNNSTVLIGARRIAGLARHCLVEGIGGIAGWSLYITVYIVNSDFLLETLGLA